MNNDELQELISVFIAETQECLQSMETHLLSLEKIGITQRKDAVKEMFRAAHSIKGSASMLGFPTLSNAAHQLEDSFAILRDRADLSTLNSMTITLLLQGVDHLRHLTQESINHKNDENQEIYFNELDAITEIKYNLESEYGKPTRPMVSPVNQSVAPETLQIIFKNDLMPVFNSLETELSQVTESELSKTLNTLNEIYYQLSGVAGMLQLTEFAQITEGLRTLIDTPNLTVEKLQSRGWAIAQNLQTARQQILTGEVINIPTCELPSPFLGENQTNLVEIIPHENPDYAHEEPLIKEKETLIQETKTVVRPTIRIDLERLTELVNLVGELVINRTNLELQETELRSEVRRIRRSIIDLNQFGGQLREEYDRLSTNDSKKVIREKVSYLPSSITNHKTSFDALEMDEYTEFHTTAQEVIETTEAIAHSANKLENLALKFERSTDQLRRITEQLRSRVMQLRVVRFSRAVDHLPRALREMCITHNKEVNLLLLGRETKIDESLLDALRDPLVHLLRNAFDHGIELPEVRRLVGKPSSGQIEIEARHQGGQTIITVSDDGRGLDPEIIRKKAIEKEFVTEEQAQELSISDLYEFLFLPGFSTVLEVSNLSGRGVGLDVVRTNLRAVRGIIKVDSRPGKGTSFIIKLPLMLSIADALMVRTDHNTVAIPLDSVEEILHIESNQIQMAATQAMLWWRDEFIRLVRLQDLLKYAIPHADGPSPDPLNQDHIPVVVLASSEGVVAVAVERLIGQQEIVVKPLPPPLSKPPGILGSTILGEGRVITIIDVDDLISQFQSNGTEISMSNQSAVVPTTSIKAPQILVVDDSYTIRQLLKLTLTRSRYRVVLAKDGLDALEKLKKGLDCHLILADIEMPRMDGFELLKAIKSTPSLAEIPVAMLTSRSGAKHRKTALELGAIQYLTKPYTEANLLKIISQIIKVTDG
jgi:two-component system, chemotaxis family, sensor histidine kinase and response regulator PixL